MGSPKKLTGAVLFCKQVKLFQTFCRLRSPWLVAEACGIAPVESCTSPVVPRSRDVLLPVIAP